MARSKLEKSTGRRPYPSYAQLPHEVIESRNFRRLSGHAVKLFIDLYGTYNGRNNGDFSCAWALMKQRGWRSRETLSAALDEVLHYGIFVETRKGGMNRTTLYGVTFQPINECNGKLDIKPSSIKLGTWKEERPDWNREIWKAKMRTGKGRQRRVNRLVNTSTDINNTSDVSVRKKVAHETTH